MPTVTARDGDVTQREATARVKIAEALRGTELTAVQAVDLLATMAAEHTKRLEAQKARELDAKETAAAAVPRSMQDIVREDTKGLDPFSR
jgi:hypothetical protein